MKKVSDLHKFMNSKTMSVRKNALFFSPQLSLCVSSQIFFSFPPEASSRLLRLSLLCVGAHIRAFTFSGLFHSSVKFQSACGFEPKHLPHVVWSLCVIAARFLLFFSSLSSLKKLDKKVCAFTTPGRKLKTPRVCTGKTPTFPKDTRRFERTHGGVVNQHTGALHRRKRNAAAKL